MPTSIAPTVKNKIQVCFRCYYHEYKKNGGSMCPKKKWVLTPTEGEQLFINPKAKYYIDSGSLFWFEFEHSVDCEDYTGKDFVITQVTSAYNQESIFTSKTGEKLNEGGIVYEIEARSLQTEENLNLTINVNEVPEKVKDWIFNLQLT